VTAERSIVVVVEAAVSVDTSDVAEVSGPAEVDVVVVVDST